MVAEMPLDEAEEILRNLHCDENDGGRYDYHVAIEVLLAEYGRLRHEIERRRVKSPAVEFGSAIAEVATELAVFWGGDNPNNAGSKAVDGKCILRSIEGVAEFHDMNVDPPGGKPFRLARRRVVTGRWFEVPSDG